MNHKYHPKGGGGGTLCPQGHVIVYICANTCVHEQKHLFCFPTFKQWCNYVRKVGVGRKVVIISGNSTIEKGLPKAKRSGTWMSHLKGRVTMQEKKEWRKKKHNKEILHIYFLFSTLFFLVFPLSTELTIGGVLILNLKSPSEF